MKNEKVIYYINNETTLINFVVDSLIEIFDYSHQEAIKLLMGDNLLAWFEPLSSHFSTPEKFLVFKASNDIVNEKAKKLQDFINSHNEKLEFIIK